MSNNKPHSFAGKGTLNGMEIATTGDAIINPREDGISSII